jgi:hypothetical protein
MQALLDGGCDRVMQSIFSTVVVIPTRGENLGVWFLIGSLARALSNIVQREGGVYR